MKEIKLEDLRCVSGGFLPALAYLAIEFVGPALIGGAIYGLKNLSDHGHPPSISDMTQYIID